MIAEYVYFGLRPVAVKNGSNINIVHTDYLTTPRIVTSGGSIVWQWRNDNPYGNNLAQGNIEFNLRFAGQYYDAESGLHYNIHRTYNPEIGRYMQSDPMGLSAGSNTYNYVGRNPFDGIDPLGLDVWIEGSSYDEPGPHQSLSIGDPWGAYISKSFAIDHGGSVYDDMKSGGQVLRLIKTTPEMDKKILDYIKSLENEDNKKQYMIDYTCIGWTNEKFELIKNKFNLKEEINVKIYKREVPRSFDRKIAFSSSSTTNLNIIKWLFGN